MSPNLNLPYLAPNQAQKHVTVNESLRRLDVLVQLTAVSASLAAEPANAADGDVYILPPGKTGPSWGAMANHALAALIDGAWEELQPRAGWRAYVTDQSRSLAFQSGVWSPLDAGTARERLNGPRTYFVRLDGADTQTGLADTPAGALRTIQAAIDLACGLDLNGHDVTIDIANGTWTQALRFRSLIGDGNVILLGDETTPSNVYLLATNATAVSASGVRGRYSVRGLKIDVTGSGHGLLAGGAGAYLSFRNIQFGAVAGSHIYAEAGATIESLGPYAITGSAERHANALLRSEVNLRNSAVTLTGTPAFSAAFINAARLAVVNANGMTFAGAATGRRHDASANAVIFTNGASTSYFPGSLAGTAVSGAQYV